MRKMPSRPVEPPAWNPSASTEELLDRYDTGEGDKDA